METDKHYFFVGSFVILTVLAILGFAVWLTSVGKGDFVKYRIGFTESVSGLSVGGAVKYRGVSVGSVAEITIDSKDTRFIRVVILVDKDTPVKTDTVASLKLQGITGIVFVELSGGGPNAQNLAELADDGNIPEIKSKSSPLNAIVDRMPELLDRITNGVEQINKMMSNENIAAFSNVIAQFSEFSTQLSTDARQIAPLLENANNIAVNLNDITESSRGDIKDTVENLNRSSQQLDALMRDLRRTSHHISNLTENLDEDPSRLIFPSKEKGVPVP